MIADVVFDLPLDHPFSYVVPDSLHLEPGQRVRAPLGGRSTRVGLVVALREGDAAGLRPIQLALEPAPILSAAGLRLGRWIADESLSSWGSTLLALLPPPPRAKRAEALAPPFEGVAGGGSAPAPEVWMDAAREERLAAAVGDAPGGALVIAPDTDSAGRWARRLDAARLDSGVPEPERRRAWFAASRGKTVKHVSRAGRATAKFPARRAT